MGKVVAFLLCSLLGATVFGQSMARDSLRVSALRQCNLGSTGSLVVTTGDVNGFIAEAIAQISTDFPAVQKTDTVFIVKTDEGGVLPTDFVAMRWCFLSIGDTTRLPLEPQFEDSLPKIKRPIAPVDANQSVDDPTDVDYYYTNGGRVFIDPKWARRDTCRLLVGYYAKGRIPTSGSDTTDVHPKFRDELVAMVCWRIEQMRSRLTQAAYIWQWYSAERQMQGFEIERESKK